MSRLTIGMPTHRSRHRDALDPSIRRPEQSDHTNIIDSTTGSRSTLALPVRIGSLLASFRKSDLGRTLNARCSPHLLGSFRKTALSDPRRGSLFGPPRIGGQGASFCKTTSCLTPESYPRPKPAAVSRRPSAVLGPAGHAGTEPVERPAARGRIVVPLGSQGALPRQRGGGDV